MPLPNQSTVLHLLAQLCRRDSATCGMLPPKAVMDFERRTGIHLPEEFVSWLSICNGAHTAPGGLFGIETNDSFTDIEERMSHNAALSQAGFVPIAGDGSGNLFAIDVHRRIPGINGVFWVNTLHSADSAECIVATNIWSFLTGHLSAELWSGWPFRRTAAIEADPRLNTISAYRKPWELE